MIHPGKQGDNTQLFHAGQHHGVTSFKIHWAYYTEAGTGLQVLNLTIDLESSNIKLDKITRWKRPIINHDNSNRNGL